MYILYTCTKILYISHMCVRTISTICDVELLLASVWVLAAKPPSSLRLGWSRHCSYQMYHWSITGNIYLIRAKCNNQTLHKKIKKVTKMLWNKCNFAWFPQKTLLAWVGLHCLSKILQVVNQGGHNCGWKLGAGRSSVQIYFRKVSNKVSLCSLQYYSLLKAKCQTKPKHAVLPWCQAYWVSGKSKEIMPVYDYNDTG